MVLNPQGLEIFKNLTIGHNWVVVEHHLTQLNQPFWSQHLCRSSAAINPLLENYSTSNIDGQDDGNKCR